LGHIRRASQPISCPIIIRSRTYSLTARPNHFAIALQRRRAGRLEIRASRWFLLQQGEQTSGAVPDEAMSG